MSQIKQTLSTLASASVSAGSTPVPGLSQSTIKNSAVGQTPVRILSLITNGQASITSFTFGNAACKVEWTLTDTALLIPIGQGLGLADAEVMQADYVSGYVDWLRTNRKQGDKVTIVGAVLTPGVIEWPQGSGVQYYGVEAILTVSEVI